jgi:hypothetical protein
MKSIIVEIRVETSHPLRWARTFVLAHGNKIFEDGMTELSKRSWIGHIEIDKHDNPHTFAVRVDIEENDVLITHQTAEIEADEFTKRLLHMTKIKKRILDLDVAIEDALTFKIIPSECLC